jgi:hypothetical protein
LKVISLFQVSFVVNLLDAQGKICLTRSHASKVKPNDEPKFGPEKKESLGIPARQSQILSVIAPQPLPRTAR